MDARVRAFLIGGALLGLAMRAKRASAAAPEYQLTIGPARIIKTPHVVIGDAVIQTGAGVQTPSPRGAGVRVPMSVSFDVAISGFEKWGVSAADVKNTVIANAGVLPGKGSPTVKVTDTATGYRVSVAYPDSTRSVSSREAKRSMEGIDSRLKGRIANVRVRRA